MTGDSRDSGVNDGLPDNPPTRTTYMIQTFTMAADLGEDRIRLHTVDPQGVFQVITMTRRLADRFVPLLARHAEGRVSSGLPPELALSFEQEQLRMDRDEHREPEVRPAPDAAPWLCQTIHLNERSDGVQWTLTNDTTIEAHMVLDDQAVRAVLDVFLITYRNLEWSEQAFPDWVASRGQDQAIPPGSLN